MGEEETRRDWEILQVNENDVTERLRIAHGWLYRTTAKNGVFALVFVPAAAGE